MQPTQTNSEIQEEHLLNFVVNSLDEELAIDLGGTVEVTTEKLYEVLAGTSAGGTSINHVCETTDDSPHANTVRGHLTDQFDLDTVEAVGDTLFHAYATLYARVRNKRYTLAVRQFAADDTTSDVLAAFLEPLDGLDLGVTAIYLDRGFYNSTCLGLLYAHNYAQVMPIVKWGETIREELDKAGAARSNAISPAR